MRGCGNKKCKNWSDRYKRHCKLNLLICETKKNAAKEAKRLFHTIWRLLNPDKLIGYRDNGSGERYALNRKVRDYRNLKAEMRKVNL